MPRARSLRQLAGRSPAEAYGRRRATFAP
jgi:hypothetical protein